MVGLVMEQFKTCSVEFTHSLDWHWAYILPWVGIHVYQVALQQGLVSSCRPPVCRFIWKVVSGTWIILAKQVLQGGESKDGVVQDALCSGCQFPQLALLEGSGEGATDQVASGSIPAKCFLCFFYSSTVQYFWFSSPLCLVALPF
jgi:hypothetical protein